MKLTSVFADNQKIPAKYTCDGENVNPELTISGVPAEGKSLALIVDDPDAPVGRWTHWLVWNIQPGTTVIAENSTAEGAVVGQNDFGRNNYGGPCPPSGTHRYRFKVFALDRVLNLPESTKQADLESAITGHILDQDILTGLFR